MKGAELVRIPHRYLRWAKAYLRSSAALRLLLQRADKKKSVVGEPVGEPNLPSQIKDLIQLVRARMEGRYTAIPLKAVLKVVAALLYFVLVFDAVPDFIPVVGLLDDISVILITLKSVKKDLQEFRRWRDNKKASQASASSEPA